MNALALFMLLVTADPVQVPVAGRPADWSGAVGGPFEVKQQLIGLAAGNQAEVGQELQLEIAVSGQGDLSNLRLTILAPKLETLLFENATIARTENDDVNDPAFVTKISYPIRFTVVGCIELRPIKFVYFNPKNRGWETTYSEPLTIRVVAKPIAHSEALQSWANQFVTVGICHHERTLQWKIMQFASSLGILWDPLDPSDSSPLLWAAAWLAPLLIAVTFVAYGRVRRTLVESKNRIGVLEYYDQTRFVPPDSANSTA